MAQNAPIAVITELALRGPRRPSQLATFTESTSGGVTKMVDRLEESGLVARTVGEVPRDRRAVTVRLTDKGEQLARAVADAVLEQMSLLRALTAELTGLIDVIDDQAETLADQAGISRRRAPKRPAARCTDGHAGQSRHARVRHVGAGERDADPRQSASSRKAMSIGSVRGLNLAD